MLLRRAVVVAAEDLLELVDEQQQVGVGLLQAGRDRLQQARGAAELGDAADVGSRLEADPAERRVQRVGEP